MAPTAPPIPGFDFAALLGRGGMGEVWKARQHGIDRWVAVKVLHPRLSEDQDYVKRFQREARLVGRLWHHNIARAFDCGQAAGRDYLVMEFVEGTPLDRLLQERRVLPEREALELVRAVADGLGYAWERRIIHRDIKPQNILVTPDGVPKLCDLGLSRDVSEATRLTLAGDIACTPAYASPEQAQGETSIDTRSDLYSLGVMLYQIVTGTLPFDSASPAALLVKHVNDAPPAPVSRNPKLSPGVNRLILDLLEKNPARRPVDPAALIARIDGLLAGRPETRVAPSKRRRSFGRPSSSTPALAIGGGVAAVVLLLVVLAASSRSPAPPAPPPKTRPLPPPPVAERPDGTKGTVPFVPSTNQTVPFVPGTKGTVPFVPPADPAEEPLRRLREFAEANPDDLPARIRETEKTLAQIVGTPRWEELRKELDTLRSSRRADLDKVRADLDARVRAAVGKEDFIQAAALWKDTAAKHPDAPWIADQPRALEEISRAADTAFAPLLAEAGKGDAAAVARIRKRVAAWGLPRYVSQLDAELAAVPPAPPPAPPPPAPAPPPPAAAPARPKPPGSTERSEIRKKVRGIFKDDYAKTDVEEVRALAGKLLKAAESTEDAATRYVFLEEAREHAVRASHAGLAFAATERIAAEYGVDERREWSDTLGRLARAARDPAAAGALAAAGLERARRTVLADDFEAAAEFLKAAEGAAPRSEDPGATAAAVLEATRDLQKIRTAHRAVQKDLRTLEADPTHPEANLAAGRYFCFAKGDWPRGLEHLKQGSDKALREAAERELAAGTDAAKRAETADGWMAVREARAVEHALDLYRSAWPALAGIPRERARAALLAASAVDGPLRDAPPAGWYVGPDSRRELYRLDGSRRRAGRSCLKVEAGGGKGWMSQGPHPVIVGKEYEFSAWILSDQAEEWTLCNVYFYEEPKGRILGGVHLTASADQPWWTLTRQRFKVPAGTKVLMIMVTQGLSKGAAWVDDLSLRALDTGEELVVNGQFER